MYIYVLIILLILILCIRSSNDSSYLAPIIRSNFSLNSNSLQIAGNRRKWRWKVPYPYQIYLVGGNTSTDTNTNKPIPINELKSNTSKQLNEIANRSITSLPLPLPLESIKAPTSNNSKETINELNNLAKLTSRRNKAQEQFYQEVNQQSIIKYWLNYAGSNGLSYDDVTLTKLATDLETLITKIQLLYNRPRPCILAYLYGIPLKNFSFGSMKNSTDCCRNTPSYPSKSTFLSNIIAYVLSVQNPDRQDEINALYKKIELVNLYSGTHYQSDLDTANQIAEIVKPLLKL